MSRVILSGLLNGLSGTTGRLVFVKTATGTRVRARITPHNPQTPAQSAARLRLRQAMAAYATLTDAQLLQWREYAHAVNAQNLQNGRLTALRSNSVFCGLACKYLQVTPDGVVPAVPPATLFLGDGIQITAQAGANRVQFTASGANASDVQTELLLQKLVTRFRTPQPDKYRTQGFAAFTADSLTWETAVPAGWYAAAVRFVQARTGQESALIPLAGILQAG